MNYPSLERALNEVFFRLTTLDYVRQGCIELMAQVMSASESEALSSSQKRSKVRELLPTIVADQSNQVSESEYIYSILGDELDRYYEGDVRWSDEVKGTLRDQVVELIQG